MNEDIICQECEAEFKVIGYNNINPEFCPYCGEKLSYDDKNVEDWYDDETDMRGC